MKPDADVDVIVIGAGPGGGSCAWALARSGVRVLLLDAGPAYDPATDYRLHRPDWEQNGFPDRAPAHDSYSFAPLQRLEPRWDELRSWSHIHGHFTRGERRRGWRYHHVQGIGGSTLHFSGEAHRLHPRAMQLQRDFGVAADWPFDYAELEPFYEQAEALIGVTGPTPDRSRPRRRPYPQPAHPPSYAGRRLLEAGRRLGQHWQANSLAALSRPHAGRPACNYCANCARGCPRGDKGSADVTFIQQARASGRCRVLPGTRVQRLIAGPDQRIRAVEYIDAEGRRGSLSARIIVLAAGAVQTPRLLLLSDNAHAPAGVGNAAGQVGRHFMETLAWTSSALHPEPLGSQRGLPMDVVCWDYNAPDALDGLIGGCRFAAGTAEADLLGPINYARRVVPGWGRAHKQQLRERFGRALSVVAIGEFLPNDRTCIDLDPERTDAHGLPLARIHSYIDEPACRRLLFMARTCRDLLQAAGAGAPFEEYGSYDLFSATHVFGGARLGHDPEHSVVNADGRVHDWRNLYISDASLFPSSGGGESPSLTIAALGIRIAEKIRAALQSGADRRPQA